MLTTALSDLTAAFVILAVGLHLASVGLVVRRLRRPAGHRVGDWPKITLLRPVCGMDPFDAETLASSFGLDYPHYEVIFCAASGEDPIVALVRALIAQHPATPARLLVGETMISANPKLNNLAKGWAAASADWIVMTDSNVLLPRDYLKALMVCWTDDTGLVSSPPVGIRGEGLWGALECGFLNSYQARWQLAADELGLGFAQGKNLAVPRDLVNRAGGLAALGGDMAEDVAATKLVHDAGLRVRLAQRPFAQPIGRRSFAEVWQRQLRWARVRKAGFPWLFVPELLTGSAAPLAALAVLAAQGWLPLAALPLFALGWFGAEWVLARAAGWPAGWRDVLAWGLRDALVPLLWAAAWAGRGFVWRGTAMTARGTTTAPQPAVKR